LGNLYRPLGKEKGEIPSSSPLQVPVGILTLHTELYVCFLGAELLCRKLVRRSTHTNICSPSVKVPELVEVW
jgi:hypothetical protein